MNQQTHNPITKHLETLLYRPFYPFILSAYPILQIFTINIYQTYPYTLVLPLFLSILMGLSILFICKRWLGDWHAAALACAVSLFLFYAYGHILDALPPESLPVQPALPVVWVLFGAAILRAIAHFRQRTDLSVYTPTLNFMSIVFILFPIASLIRIGIATTQPFAFEKDHFVDLSNANLAEKPDVYYIIMDGYGRSDLTRNEYGFDDSKFINSLVNMGFAIAKCSQSNYPNTGMSLSSSLNMDYLQNLSQVFNSKQSNVFYFAKALRENALERSLESAGYTTVAFESGFPWAELSADHFIRAEKRFPINEFDVLLVKTTFLRALDQYNLLSMSSLSDARYLERFTTALNSSDQLAQIPGPKFVFIHIMASHIPFVVDRNGNALASQERVSIKGYVEQSTYSGEKVTALVQQILAASKTPPIIVIQGDHAPHLDDNRLNAFPILNAYYLPGHTDKIYPHISPINTFRVILNAYFGANFPLLEDISYDPDEAKPEPFTQVPNGCVTQESP